MAIKRTSSGPQWVLDPTGVGAGLGQGGRDAG
jgi:hypothetical protein